ncbi:hypothetical protein [Sandarakinorhabdus oryzae]|uniref:hypothetical protein n=1 Tax=Sandarakinorhabdus oryzae TaxID=2675220 RepID=UPI0012E114AA|nr:hypothetical protein [Sandarakinorhabdus oryzae]
MFGLFRKKPKPETLPEKFARLFVVHAELVAATRALIAELARQDQPALLIANHSHLVADLAAIAVMRWRLGEDPRAAIAEAHAAYRELIACRDRADPGHALPMDAIAGITDWDLVHALFWLAGTPEPVVMQFPRLEQERYFAYSRFLLLRVTGAEVPAALAAAVAQFDSGDGLVDKDFRDKLALLDGDGDAQALVGRIAGYWPIRRRNGFYQSSAPLPAGFDASNDLSVDWQLACILKLKGLEVAGPHGWRW